MRQLQPIQKVVEWDNYRPFFLGKKIQQNFKIPEYLMEEFLEFMKNQYLWNIFFTMHIFCNSKLSSKIEIFSKKNMALM